MRADVRGSLSAAAGGADGGADGAAAGGADGAAAGGADGDADGGADGDAGGGGAMVPLIVATPGLSPPPPPPQALNTARHKNASGNFDKLDLDMGTEVDMDVIGFMIVKWGDHCMSVSSKHSGSSCTIEALVCRCHRCGLLQYVNMRNRKIVGEYLLSLPLSM